MRSMTFQVDDQSTGSAIPAIVVTITENADGSLSFTLNVVGSTTGDLRGFFFDLANESRIGTLSVTDTSAAQLSQGNDSVTNLGNGANMQGLVGSDGGYDAGIEIGTAGTGKDDYQSFTFRLASSAGALTLDDFANVDFGVRLNSVGEVGGSRDGTAKLLEHTTGAIDALDDANAITEDGAPNTVSGNVFANDLHLGTSHRVMNPGILHGTYGTLQLNADGSYTYTLNNAAVQFLAVGETRTDTFTYLATASDEATSSSTDSATLAITITGANDAPVITSGAQSGVVSEGDDGSSRNTSGQVTFTDADVLDTHTWSASSALYGAASVDGDGTWHYAVADFGAVDALSVGELLADGFDVTVDDGHGGTASQAVAITIVGTNDPITILTPGQIDDFVEDDGHLGTGSEILFSDPDRNDTHTSTVAPAASNTTAFGSFTTGPVSEPTDTALGSAPWSFVLDHEAAQVLGAGMTAIETYTVMLSDGQGSSASRDFTFRIHGVNDAPLITGGVTTGQVYEDGGARTASGQLTAFDIDHNAALIWGIGPDHPEFGGVSIDPTGRWTYFLNNAAVQNLAQGQSITDTFTVSVSDQHFASSAPQTVTVTITGTEDRPLLDGVTNPDARALSVTEDGPAGSTQAFASDVDNGSVLHWSINRGSTLGYFSPYEFRADSFKIVKNGADLFFDDFTVVDPAADLPPPDAPNFLLPPPPGGSAETFYTTGGILEEADGKLVFKGTNAGAFRGTGNNNLIVGNEAIVATNADPNPLTGLKRNHQFVVEGVFDLIDPALVRQQYGIQLTDGVNQLADDLVLLTVRRDDDGLFVRLSNNNQVLDTSNVVTRLPLVPGSADQIRLSFSHTANAGSVSASYELLDKHDDGTVTVIGGGFLGQVGIFGTDTGFPGDDNNWIRGGLIANALDVNEVGGLVQTLTGTYGTLSVSNATFNDVGDLVYTPNNALPAVQALALGESATDSFFVRVVDQFGMSTSQRVDVTVNGANDAPIIAGGVTTGQVYEDGGARTASGQLTAFDIDHNAAMIWGIGPDQPEFGGVSIDATGRWTYFLNNAAVQNLAQGQSITDTFTVSVTDQHFASSAPQTVSVTITGTDDQPRLGGVPNPAPLALSVTEDGPAASVQANATDVDNGALLHWSLNRGSTLGYSAPYEFRADSFSIQKNFVPLFFDGFTAGGPPPQAPDFLPTPPSAANYTTTGGLQEIDGKLVMRGADAAAFRGTGTNSLLIGNEALLATNIDPANTVSGLKRNHQFVVESVFDLIPPAVVNQQYGIQLTDGVNQISDDLVLLAVRQESDGLYVRFTNGNGVLDISTLVDRDPLTIGSADQIRLRLSHDAGAGNVSASYELIDNDIVPGAVVGGGFLGETGIFGTDTVFPGDDNNWIRAGLIASALDANEAAGLVQTLVGSYGTLTVSATGLLTYAVDNANPDVQALNDGQSVVDSFFVRVTDQFGMSSAQRVDVTVNGADDAPVVAIAGTVFEDGGRVASGKQTTPPGLDPLTTTWSADLVQVEVNPDYRFLIDNFNIRRGATPTTLTQYFNDDFGDGNPPPSVPGPVNEAIPTFVGYSVNGSFIESGGRAILDGSRAIVTDGIGTTETRFGTSARLNTDNNNNLAVNRGLKIDDAFTVEGRYDLVTALEQNQRYGIRLTDAGRNNPDGSPVPATDIVELTLSRSDAGVLRVQLRELDAAADTTTTLQNITLPVLLDGENQITFRLSHDPASPGLVNASFTLSGGAAPRTFNFAAQGTIFGTGTPGDTSDNENWTRAEFRATSGAGLQNGDYGTFEGNPQGQWTYKLNNALPAVQALAQGERVFDSFEVEATDAFGNSATQLINIAVQGTNDTPVIGIGPTNAIVVENGGALQQFTGHLNVSDVDHDASLTWSLSRSFSGYSANYDFTADDFTVVRNGEVIFLDTFTSPAPPAPPAPPPSAPNFANGTFANYLTTGIFSEDLAGDGRLHLHGSQARALAGTGTDDLRVGHIAALATNIDPADLTRGLKIDDDFSVHARFDLASLPLQGQAFGLSLVDATFGGIPPDQLPQDQPLLLVTRDAANNLVVVFSSADGVTDTVHEYARTPLLLGPADTQIVLRLDHTHDTGILQASYELRDAGNAVTGGDELGAPGYVFGRGTADPGDDEVWTRPSILAFARGDDESTTSVPGFFGTFSVTNNGDWTYALNPGNPLSAGQEFFEFASVRATDEHGASTFRQIGVNIVGTGDEPVFGPLVLFGNDMHDVLLGSPQDDVIRGRGGPDTLVGFGGRDEFQFTDFNVPIFTGPDTIVDFQPGSGGDVLNIADVIDFAPGGTASNFVRFLEVNGATQLQINQDGIGNDFIFVATLQGVTGALLNDYIANNNLVLL